MNAAERYLATPANPAALPRGAAWAQADRDIARIVAARPPLTWIERRQANRYRSRVTPDMATVVSNSGTPRTPADPALVRSKRMEFARGLDVYIPDEHTGVITNPYRGIRAEDCLVPLPEERP